MINVLERDHSDEIGSSFIKIPADMDLQPPASTSTIRGFRAPGLDHVMRATVASNGFKKFDYFRNKGNGYIFKIWERELSPVPANWDLAPGDNTYDFELWYTSQGRSLTISDFQQDYEYLFVIDAAESSTELYYNTVSFYNFASAYVFASRLHSRMLHYNGIRGWDDWIRFSGFGTTFSTTFKGPGRHKMYRIYRRPMTFDASLGYYNTFSLVANYPNELRSKGTISKAKLPSNSEIIFVTNDNHGDNELCMQGQMYLDDTLIQYASSGGSSTGFGAISGRDNWSHVWGTPSSSYRWVDVLGGTAFEIYKREQMTEYTTPPDPEPELPPPPEPDDAIPCEDRCVNVDDTYEAVARVEVNFIDPPDWQQRNYAYSWSVIGSSEVTVIGTEDDGRIGLFRLRRKALEEDDRALLPYNISVTVEDLDYSTAGVTDSDTAVLTFEMPCVVVGNTPSFSISDVDVDECGAGDTDTTATFTVTASEAVIGNDITIDYETVGITANADTTITVLASDSNDLPFLMVRETTTSKLYLDGSFTRFWNQNAGNNGPTDIMVQLLANIPTWASDGEHGNNILVIEDIAPNGFPFANTGSGGFVTTFDVAFNQVLGSPWAYSVVDTATVENEDQSYYEQFALVIYLSTSQAEGQASELALTHSMITELPNAARAGVGLAILSDHDVYQINANRILAEIEPSLQFTGGSGINRTGEVITVAGSISKHGSHPLLNNLSGQFPVAGSEAYIPAVSDNPDFTATSGTLTFADGESSKTVQVTVLCDDVSEDDETFKVVLSNPTRGTLSKSEGVGTILDSSPNVTVVELANEGTDYDIFIARDISGSMGTSGVTINGSTGTRDELVRQVLNDYTINPVEPGLTAIVGGGVSAMHRWIANVIIATATNDNSMTHINALFITDSQDRYTASAIKDTYSSPANDHPIWSVADDEPNSTTVAPMSQIDETENNWTHIGPWPAHVEEFNLTVVRVLNPDVLDAPTTTDTEQIYNDLFNAADRPALVATAQISTYTEYTTGADSEINRQIEASVLSTYTGYCTKTPGNTVTVQAADETEAISKAQPLLNCPDD